MTDSLADYSLLIADMRERAAGGLILRRSGVRGGAGEVLFGIGPDFSLHLLVPLTSAQAFEPYDGDSLTLREWQNSQHPEFPGRHLDLTCTNARLAEVFGSLVDDVLQRIQAAPNDAPGAVRAGLDAWRTLLQDARRLSVERARGLFGELVVLRLLAETNPHVALDAWTGPLGNTHDFTTSQGDIEVKTTTTEGLRLTITSLDQLDRQGDAPLALVRVRVHETPQGRTIDEMVAALVGLGCSEEALDFKTRQLGHVPGQQKASRFVVQDQLRAWWIDEDFPGLRSKDLPPNRRDTVTHVSYSIDLAAATSEMSHGELVAFCATLMSHA